MNTPENVCKACNGSGSCRGVLGINHPSWPNCNACNGTGKQSKVCDRCFGDGFIKYQHAPGVPMMRIWCDKCRGTGRKSEPHDIFGNGEQFGYEPTGDGDTPDPTPVSENRDSDTQKPNVYNYDLDEILINFAKRVEKMQNGKTYGWEDEKQAIQDLINQSVREAELEVLRDVMTKATTEGITDSEEVERQVRKYIDLIVHKQSVERYRLSQTGENNE